MISDKLPYRKLEKEFQNAFPQFNDTIVIVIDADTPETARLEAEKLAEASMGKSARTKALIQFSLNYLNKNGREKTLDAIDNPRNPDHKRFVDGEYYIWVFQTDFNNKATVVAHSVNTTLRGKEWYDVKDSDGKQFFHDIIRICKNKGEGWVLYRWAHPKYKKAMPKLTYFKKVGDLVFNNGFYLE